MYDKYQKYHKLVRLLAYVLYTFHFHPQCLSLGEIFTWITFRNILIGTSVLLLVFVYLPLVISKPIYLSLQLFILSRGYFLHSD